MRGRWIHQRLHRAGTAIVKFHPATARALRELGVQLESAHNLVRRIRARRGVVIAAGGFICNRKMVDAYAPRYRKGMPLGTAGNDGSGVLLGQSVGGSTAMMGRVSAWRFINPPQAFAEGVLINGRGERYVNEFKYGAAIGEAMVEDNQGAATLVIDAACHLSDIPGGVEVVRIDKGAFEPLCQLSPDGGLPDAARPHHDNRVRGVCSIGDQSMSVPDETAHGHGVAAKPSWCIISFEVMHFLGNE